MEYDVVILGGGAAGLFAAIAAGESGARVVVLEKNRRPGVKILMSGGTRCNLTNARGLRSLHVVTGSVDPGYDPRLSQGPRRIQQAFGEGGKFLGPALRAFSVEESVRFFEAEGVATKVEANGKIFPASDRAADVLDAILRRVERSGAALRPLSPVSRIEKDLGGFLVSSADSSLRARTVILAVGGQSFPGCGTTGDGYAIAGSLGHAIVPLRPALAPLRVDLDWVRGLKGLTLPDVTASVRQSSGARLMERREAVLFAHFGLTGPAILDVSREFARHENGPTLELELDLLPDLSAESLDQRVHESSRVGRKPIANLLPGAIPRRLAEHMVEAARIPPGRHGPELTREERRNLVAACKGLRIPVAGTLGFSKAEVTSGGVALEEVDPSTMESRLQPGLFFAGEVLDLDGLIGGYNFQGAWSTGWLAGLRAAEFAKKHHGAFTE